MPCQPRILVAYSMTGTHVQTTREYLESLERYSGCEVEYVHITNNAEITADFDRYDAVFHSYCGRLAVDGYVSESYREKMRRFRGVKIAAIQDEYERTNTVKAAIRDLGFDVALTLVRQDLIDYVYPRAEFPDTEFVTVLTGYVDDDTITRLPPPKPLSERPIFLGYRGRDLGARLGRLSYEKIQVGRGMKEICDARGIATDIAWDEDSRIYGAAWTAFIGNCRAMLGSESASHVFDFDGSIAAAYEAMTAANGGRPPTFDEFRHITEPRENEIDNAMISPRVFECAMMRTPMVLFRGGYSGCIVPDEHYIALEKDFSNAYDVLARLEDLPALEAMTERAYRHLIASGKFSYRNFAAGIRSMIDRRLAEKTWRRSDGPRRPAAPLRHTDRGRVILAEPATAQIAGPDLFALKHRLAGSVETLQQHRAVVDPLDLRVAGFLAALNAQFRILDATAQQTGHAQDLPGSVRLQQIGARRDAANAEFTAHMRTLETLNAALSAPDLVEGAPDHVALERDLQAEYARWAGKVVALLQLENDVIAANAILGAQARKVRERAGWLAYAGLRIRGWQALLKAPWRALARICIRGTEAARTHVA